MNLTSEEVGQANGAEVKVDTITTSSGVRTIDKAEQMKTLPKTGDQDTAAAVLTGMATILGAFGLVSKRRKNQD